VRWSLKLHPVVILALWAVSAMLTDTPVDDLMFGTLLAGTIRGPDDPESLIRAMPESVYRVLQPIPALGALPGDFIVVHPQDPDVPCALQRPLNLELVLRHIGGVEAPLVYAAPPTPTPSGPHASRAAADLPAAAGGRQRPMRLLP